MSLSTFILALWVFLRSSVELGWFTVDARLISYVGIAFVVALVLETVLAASGKPFAIRLPHRRKASE